MFECEKKRRIKRHGRDKKMAKNDEGLIC